MSGTRRLDRRPAAATEALVAVSANLSAIEREAVLVRDSAGVNMSGGGQRQLFWPIVRQLLWPLRALCNCRPCAVWVR